MTSREFAFWLQGFFEISGSKSLTNDQVESVKRHLNLVFIHEIDPSMGDKDHQEKLNKAHNAPSPLQPLGHVPDPFMRC